ncbi:hypothetical protein V1511DRAFT_459533 [Dipodascopsis uninucleata]
MISTNESGRDGRFVEDESIIKKNRRRWRIGLILLAIVVCQWVLSSFMVNSIFEDSTYRKPYLVTYLCTASFSLYLVRPFLQGKLSWKAAKNIIRPDGTLAEARTSETEGFISNEQADPESGNRMESQDDGLTLQETARLSLHFCILWFGANWFSNASLSYTSVASATILACTSSFFTLIIGSLFGVEKFSQRKLLAIAGALTGIILISVQDQESDEEGSKFSAGSIILGDLMSLTSAAIYGLYTSVLKFKIGDESRVNMQIFLGFVGVWNMILLWPILVILHFTGAERFELPPSNFVWFIIIANAISTFISDYLWIVSILMTSPLVVTVGLSATIPLAVVGDIMFNQLHISFWYLVGAALVGGAFFFINHDEEQENNIIHETTEVDDVEVIDAE